MRLIFVLFAAVTVTQGCIGQQHPNKVVYSWLHFETIHRDSVGKVIGLPFWEPPQLMEFPMDTFIVYGNNDSIRMIPPGAPIGKLFKKIEIHTTRWKPKQKYGKTLLFLGTYVREGLDGIYFSIYATKDWSSLMQVLYTNPGNVSSALLFSKDSINILQRDKILIDSKDESSESEEVQLQIKPG